MNPKTLEAVYEQGVLRPLERLDLPEHKQVTITISDVRRSTAESVTSCYDLAMRAGMIGALKDAPREPEHDPGSLPRFRHAMN